MLMEWGLEIKPLTLYDYNTTVRILHLSTCMTTMELGEIDSEYFHHLEKNPRVFGHQKHHEFTKKIFDHQKLFRSPTGHQVHSGCQVPSLTLCDIFNPNGCHISRSHQVHRGRQVPSLTPRNTLCPNGRHVSRGCQVPSLTPRDTFCPDGRHV